MTNSRINPHSQLITVFILWLLLSNCSTPHLAIEMPKETPLQTLTPTMISSFVPNNTETPSWTSTPVYTPTFTDSPTPTVKLPTPTPRALLSAEESKNTILGLLEDNRGCSLPCWWGLTPGKTSVKTANSFLETFEEVATSNILDEHGAYFRWLLNEGSLILDVRVAINSDQNTPEIVKVFQVTVQVTRELKGIGYEVVWENPLNAQYLQSYSLPQILNAYGLPRNVFVFGDGSFGHATWPLFNLVLDYADQGFVVRYTVLMERVDDTYLGCVANAYTTLYLWDPELNYTWAEGVTRTSGGKELEIDWLNDNFLPLEESIPFITLDEFYKIFSDPKNTTCLETPVQLWNVP